MSQLTTERVLTLFWFTLWVAGTVIIYEEMGLFSPLLATILVAASLGFLEGGSVFGVIHWLPHAKQDILASAGALVKAAWASHWAHHKTAKMLESIKGEEAARIRERDRRLPPATWIIIGIVHATTAPLVITFALYTVAYPALFCVVYYACMYFWYIKEEEGHRETHESDGDIHIPALRAVIHDFHHKDVSAPWYHLFRPHGMLTLFTGEWFIHTVIWWVSSVERALAWVDPIFGELVAAEQADAEKRLAEDHSHLVRSAPATSH